MVEFSIAMFHYQRVDGAMVLWVGWCPSWLNLERYGKGDIGGLVAKVTVKLLLG